MNARTRSLLALPRLYQTIRAGSPLSRRGRPGYHDRVTREQRLVFGEDAELYDRARPSYPAAVIDEVVERAGGAGARAADAGAGTGKAAVLLAKRGMTGVAIEPHPAMAEVARRNLAGFPGWRVNVSGFEDWRPAEGDDDAPLNLVTSAQAWHWLTPGRRLEHARELLRPGGWLALWWNRPDPNEAPAIRTALDQLYARRVPAIRGHATGAGNRPELNPIPHGWFDPPIERAVRWTRRYTTALWLDLLRTQSDHRMLAPEKRDALLGEVAQLLDRAGGVYDHAYVCHLWLARRR